MYRVGKEGVEGMQGEEGVVPSRLSENEVRVHTYSTATHTP